MTSKRKALQKADKFLASGKQHKALEIYLKTLEENPNDANLLNSVGDIFIRIGEIKQAVPHFERAAKEFEKSGFRVKAIAVLKKAYRKDSDNNELVISLVDLLKKESLVADARQLLIEIAEKRIEDGKVGEAKTFYEQILQIDPSHMSSLLQLNKIAMASNDKVAIAEIASTISQQLLRAGKLDEALDLITITYKKNPDDDTISRIYADLLKLTGNLEKSSALYRKLLEKSAADSGLLVALSELAIEMEDMTAARKYYLKAQETAPESEKVMLLGSGLAILDEDYDSAFSNLHSLYQQYEEAGSSNPAIAGLEEIVRRNPEHIPTLKKLKDIYTLAKDKDHILRILAMLSKAFENKANFKLAIAAAEEMQGIDSEKLIYKTRVEELYAKSGGSAIFNDTGTEPEPATVPESLDFTDTMSTTVEALGFEISEETMEEVSPTSANIDAEEQEIADGKVKRLLLEVDVFIRYGLTFKAKDKLNEALELTPDNASLNEKLAEVNLEDGDQDAAIELLQKAKAQRIQESNQAKVDEIDELLEEIGGGSVVSSRELLLDDDDDYDDDFVAEYAHTAESSDEPEGSSSQTPWVPSTDPLKGKLMEAEYYLEQKFISAAHHLISDLAEKHPENQNVLALSARLEELMSKEMDVAEVEKDLDEFFSPLEDKKEEGEESGFASWMEDDSDDSGDSPLSEITSLLEEDLLAIGASVEKRRSELEHSEGFTGVEDISFGKDAYKSMALSEKASKHYEMGLAYLDTGLHEDAIKGFEIAAEDSAFFQRSCLQLGICNLNKGDEVEAVKWLQKGLGGGGDVSVMVDILHQLAIIHQIKGETESFKHALSQLESLAPEHPGLATLKALE
jgi:tetratricopeptide (TPR) repeat protein